MAHTLNIPDEQYELLAGTAHRTGRTPQQLLADLIGGLRDPLAHPRYLDTDEWFRHLGATDDMIEREKREVEAEAETDADTRRD